MIRRGILARAKAGMADLRAQAQWNKPPKGGAGKLRVILGVEEIDPDGSGLMNAAVAVDMETGREIIAAAEEIIERRLAAKPRRERPAHG